MNWIRTHWSKLSTGILVATLFGTGAVAARNYLGGDCCAQGAACCKPGAPCCHHGDRLSAR